MGNESQPKRHEAARRLIDLAAELGNVSEACRRLAMDRSAYYRNLKVKLKDGSNAEPPRRKASASDGLAESVLRLCLEYPEWGCDRLAHYLCLTKGRISSPTVQKILIRNGLGRMEQREKEAKRRKRGADGNQVSP